LNQNSWFANKGQFFQLVVAAIACVLAGIKAWPELRVKEVFSFGAIVFYALIAVVVVLLALKVRNHLVFKTLALCAMVAAGTWEIEDTIVVKSGILKSRAYESRSTS
jgi:hypothetical protein